MLLMQNLKINLWLIIVGIPWKFSPLKKDQEELSALNFLSAKKRPLYTCFVKNIEIHLSVTLMNKERFLDFRRFFGSFVFVNLTKNGFRSGKRHIFNLGFWSNDFGSIMNFKVLILKYYCSFSAWENKLI